MRKGTCAGVLAVLVLMVWLAGCGRAVGGVAPSAFGGTASAAAGGATPSAAATYANTSPPAQAGGAVRLTTDHTSYRPNEPIHVTVTNTLDQSIYALDTRASCSILELEWQAGGGWQPAEGARCPLGRMALVVAIAPGATYQTTITAGYPGLRAANFPPGTYQLVLSYTVVKLGPGETGAGTTVYSASFTIAGNPLPPIPVEPTVPIAVTATLLP